jgi:hypothetical protein
MADEKQIFAVLTFAKEIVEVGQGGFRGETVGGEDAGFVAGFGGDELSGLERALERAGDDEIEVDLEGVEDMGEVEAVLLAFSIEWTLEV